MNDLSGQEIGRMMEVVDSPGSSYWTTPAKRNAHSLIWRIDARDEELTLEQILKSRVIKLALTLGTVATALLAGAASLRIG
ncbi:MAG: hypothetical protein ACR2N7_08265 [Acidimicrobiia bacterium]